MTLTDGRTFGHDTKFPPGTPENPLGAQAVADKARDVMTPVLGAHKAQRLIDVIDRLESLSEVRSLRSLFTL